MIIITRTNAVEYLPLFYVLINLNTEANIQMC